MSIHQFHNLAFGFYNLCWTTVLPWLKLNRRLAEGYQDRILKGKMTGTADLWIQAASVGEAFLAVELVKTLKTRKVIRILLTSNTRQGIDVLNQNLQGEIKTNQQVQAAIRYFPFDKPSLMKKAVDRIQPKLMVLLESEIWPGLMRSLKKSGCRTLIVNGRITEKSLKRYLLWPSVWRLLSPDRILAISADDAERFRQLFGKDNVDVMPNIKFDRLVPPPAAKEEHNGVAAILPPDIPFVVLASVRKEEESLVNKVIAEIFSSEPKCIIGLFPRHLHRIHAWQETLNKGHIRWVLRSNASGAVSAGTVVLWDTVGELVSAYRFAKSAFVGGSLAPLGGQNFLEAIISGVIPVIGPSWENFAWVGPEIVDKGWLRVAQDWKEVAQILLEDFEHPTRHDEVIKGAINYIRRRQGGSDQACRQIETLLKIR
jgi:3-deoxy-D-manno-octulosonic-acid transferase